MDIQVKVANKVASVIGAPVIICGNSDYSITFTFDQEWELLDFKTARFVYKRNGALEFIDVVFNGRTTAVPVLSNIDEVYVGVYAGELRTTTPARILCKKSILCSAPSEHEAPDPDVYEQIIELINNMETLPAVGAVDAGKALMVNGDGHWTVRLPDFMHDQNTGKLIRFFFGTQAEYDAWTGDKTDVLFVKTDDTTLEDLDQALDDIDAQFARIISGEQSVGHATTAGHATSADTATTAGHATSADTATTAGHATSADTATTADGVTLLAPEKIEAIGGVTIPITEPGLYLVVRMAGMTAYESVLIPVESLDNYAFGFMSTSLEGVFKSVKYQPDTQAITADDAVLPLSHAYRLASL